MTDASSGPPSPPSRAVDALLSTLAPGPARITAQLRELVRQVAPQAEEDVQDEQPTYSVNQSCIFIRPMRDHVDLGFRPRAPLPDPFGLLTADGEVFYVRIATDHDPDLGPLAALIRAVAEADPPAG